MKTNLEFFIDPSRCIDATSEDLRIRHHHYREVRLDDFIRGLHDRGLTLSHVPLPPKAEHPRRPWVAVADALMTSARLFARLVGVDIDDAHALRAGMLLQLVFVDVDGRPMWAFEPAAEA